MVEPNAEPNVEANAEPYLPAECLAAIAATNQKYDSMKDVWNNYISNLRNGENLLQSALSGHLAKLQHSLKHVQNIGAEHLDKHNSLRLGLARN